MPWSRRRLLRAALAPWPAALLGGCGFALRQPPKLNFERIYLDLPAQLPLTAALRRQLQGIAGMHVLTEPSQRAQAQVVLHSPGEVRERVVVSVTAAGEVRELQLRLRFGFRASTPDGRELLPQAELERQMDQSYSETAALSKEQESNMLFDSMQDDIVQQVLARLAHIQPTP